MHRLFIQKDQLPVIKGSDVHYLKDVLRLKIGDQLELFDGSGTIYLAKISKIEKDRILTEIISQRTDENEPRVKIAIAQALAKGHKMDFIIEKCTELGAFKIIPILTERTISRSAKLPRWRKLAKEAAEQSGRSVIPEITSLMTFEEVLGLKKQYDQTLIPWELEKSYTLKKHFTDIPISRYPDILVMIGPEGGFSQKEIEAARAAGFQSVSLGKRILRTETAGMAVLAALAFQFEA